MSQISSAGNEVQADISRIVKSAPSELIGREEETGLLDDSWQRTFRLEKGHPHVLIFVALGGEGKTSLVAKWIADLAAQNWPGCNAAFAWSFYSQGTRDQLAASSDLFLKEALTFFGDEQDKAFAASPAGAFEKGQRLARVVGQRRSLLILDGLEPLQYAPTSPTPGQLKDQGIAALLKGLAAASHGLCVITTRYSIPDLRAFWQTTAAEVPLLRLSGAAGVHLLKALGVRKESGTEQEFETLVEEVKGHALTLTILGGFLKRAFHGDIRQRDRVKFQKADEKMDGGHAFRTMAAYEQWLLRDGGDEGLRELTVLRLMGLFDRPADAGCLAALRRELIPGLTESLAGMAEDDWEFCLSGLEAAKLLTVNSNATGALVSLDAHPHLREYFAKHLREQNPDAWRAAHRRLYEHLCASSSDRKSNPTIEDLQPIYRAVCHACRADLPEEAWVKLFDQRILRGAEYYSYQRLGAVGSDLEALSCFFETKWTRVSPLLGASTTRVLNATALRLRLLGRLEEALEANLKAIESDNPGVRAVTFRNLSELQLLLGRTPAAIAAALSGLAEVGPYMRLDIPATLANALFQAGHIRKAKQLYQELDQAAAKHFAKCPLLSSVAGFHYCDLLLCATERALWRLNCTKVRIRRPKLAESCRSVSQRAARTLEWAESSHKDILSIGLDHLTLGRSALYAAILAKSDVRNAAPEIEQAVAHLRRSNAVEACVAAFLTRAWLRFLTGARTGPGSTQADLDEAWEIAERGPMRMHMADIHLHRARLFFREAQYPWKSPEWDLAAAEKLIKECGYHRRDEELAVAKAAIPSK